LTWLLCKQVGVRVISGSANIFAALQFVPCNGKNYWHYFVSLMLLGAITVQCYEMETKSQLCG